MATPAYIYYYIIHSYSPSFPSVGEVMDACTCTYTILYLQARISSVIGESGREDTAHGRYRQLAQLAPGTTRCRFNLLWDCRASFPPSFRVRACRRHFVSPARTPSSQSSPRAGSQSDWSACARQRNRLDRLEGGGFANSPISKPHIVGNKKRPVVKSGRHRKSWSWVAVVVERSQLFQGVHRYCECSRSSFTKP